MKIKRLYIKNFGSLENKEFSLSDGINVVFGGNESGKSTFLSFFRFMFFGAKKQRGKELSFRDKYMPWQGSDMSGEIEFSSNGTDYFISRTVSASGRKKNATVINKTTGDTLDISDDEIGSFFFGVSEQAFLKTLFLGSEGSKIDSDSELLTKISNVAKSGDDKISYQAIYSELNNSIAELSSPRRARAVIPALENKLTALEEKKKSLEDALCQKQELTERLSKAEASLEKALQKKNLLSEKEKLIEKYNCYSAFKKCASGLEKAELEYKSALNVCKDTDINYDFLNNISPEDEKIILSDTTAKNTEARMQKLILEDKKNSRFKFSAVSVVFSLSCCVTGFFSHWFFLLSALCLIFGIYFFVSAKGNDKKINSISEKIDAVEKEKADILKKYSLESTQHYNSLKQEKESKEAENSLQKAAIDMAKRIYEEQKNEYDAMHKEICDKYGSVAEAECEKPDFAENLSSEQAKNDEEILIFTAESAKIKSSAEATNVSRQEISDILQDIADCSAELSDAREKERILNLALEILDDAYEELKSNFAPRLAKSTAQIFNTLTHEKYGELIVTDAFEIQIKNDGEYENAGFFSSGTIQQLYFALRLGIIELTMENCPLFLDDPFITYDDERFNSTVSFLNNCAKDHQIILCTCHERECMAANSLLKF